MEIERKFLGYREPLLQTAASFLVETFGYDLQGIRVAVTSRRAARRLVEILLSYSEEAGEVLIVPRKLFSVGELPEQFYDRGDIFASTVERLLAWEIALSRTEDNWLKALTRKSDKLSKASLLGLAQRIDSIWSEISASCLRFADVADKIDKFTEFSEEERWRALELIYNSYCDVLAEASLCDKNTRRIEILSAENKLAVEEKLILLGTAELSLLNRNFLKQSSGYAISLIQAPQADAANFDEYGCILTESWGQKNCPLTDSQIYVAHKPIDQVRQALAFIEKSCVDQSVEDITIGITDSKFIPATIEEFNSAGCPIRSAEGFSLNETSVFRLLFQAVSYAKFRKISDFAALLRHADFSLYLTSVKEIGGNSSRYISQLDKFIEDHLPQQVSAILELEKNNYLSKIHEHLEELFVGFADEKLLEEWITTFAKFLDRVYNVLPEQAAASFESCELFADSLAEVASAKLLAKGQKVDPFFALQLISKVAETKKIPNEAGDVAAELLGWLELALDDAPIVFVIGFNEGRVPESINSDSFLPNSLRTYLGLSSNETRFARDMYILTVLANSTKKFAVSCGKKSEEGELLLPSRLLLTTEKDQQVQRILRFCNTSEIIQQETTNQPDYLLQTNFGFPRKPEIASVGLPESFSVTAYQAYLECPYRFYLRHLLKLRRVNDLHCEMSPQLFGTIAHAALAKFATSKDANSSDEKIIARALREILEDQMLMQFGRQIQPIVALQGELLHARLAAFAKQQASWRAKGWVIHEVEIDLKKEDLFSVKDQGSLGVHGRIDRIDYNELTNQWAILDYKTGEKAHKLKSHFDKEWSSVQLPLYYLLAKEKLTTAQINLGFINLAKDLETIKIEVLACSEDDIQSGLLLAQRSAKGILERNFWPPSDLTYTDEYADICSTGMLAEIETELED